MIRVPVERSLLTKLKPLTLNRLIALCADKPSFRVFISKLNTICKPPRDKAESPTKIICLGPLKLYIASCLHLRACILNRALGFGVARLTSHPAVRSSLSSPSGRIARALEPLSWCQDSRTKVRGVGVSGLGYRQVIGLYF